MISMKTIQPHSLSFILLLMVLAFPLAAQSPYGINYQAFARNSEGQALTSQDLTVILSISDPFSADLVLWEETQDVTTSSLGLFVLTIGIDPGKKTGGSISSFNNIPWEAGPLNLEIKIVEGGEARSLGKSAIQAAPVALYGRDEDADNSNELQGLNLSNGILSLNKTPENSSVSLHKYLLGEVGWQREADTVYYMEGNVGVGTVSPQGILEVKSKLPGDEPIFQVKNDQGVPVFAVYNEGVEITIPETVAKGAKSGFAVGGYNSGSKVLPTGEYFFQIKPEGANINFLTDDNAKGLKSGFAVGGYNSGTKTDPSSYIYMDPYAVPFTYEDGSIIPIFETLTPKGNCYVGTMAGQLRRGQFNTSVGYQSGYNINAALTYPLLFSAAKYNTNLGAFAGYSNVYGDYNVNLGYQAGYTNTLSSNVFVGYQAGYGNNGSGNVFIGNKAGYNEAGSNMLYITNNNTDPPLIKGDFSASTLQINGNAGINVSGLTGYGLRVITPSGPTEYFALRVYGDISATGSVYSSSDENLKDNIQILEDPLARISRLKGVTFSWNESAPKGARGKNQIGVIAQDVEKVFPELVKKDEEGMLSVNYMGLIPVLIESVKVQQTEIELLREENATLKEELETIKLMLNNLSGQ